MGKVDRDSNMELLRIVSMFCIVLSHSAVHGLRPSVECLDAGAGLENICELMRVFGCLGVNCFVLISGYYMVTSRTSLSKLLKLWVTVWTYSAGLFLLMNLTGRIQAGEMVRSFLPLLRGKYWFVSVYVVLMLVSPFLNHYIRSLSRLQLVRFLATLFLLLVVIPTRSFWWGGELVWFVFLYGVAACVRLHGSVLKEMPARRWFACAGGLALLFIGLGSILWLPENVLTHPLKTMVVMGCTGKTSLLPFLLAFCIFVGFTRCRIGCVRWLNAVAACSFGVYLIHDHSDVRSLIWHDIFHLPELASSSWLLPWCVGASFIIYCTCTLMEMLRQVTLGRLYDFGARLWILPLAYAVWGYGRRFVDRFPGEDRTKSV